MSELERTKYLRDLRRQMTALFNLEELRALAFDLSVDWDVLPGEGKDTKVQSLIMHQARRGRLADLVTLLREERPDAHWPKPPPSDQQMEDEGDIVPDSVRAAAMQEYLHKMTTKVVTKRRTYDENDEDWEEYDQTTLAIAKALTAAILLYLDKSRLVVVIRFLGEIGLSGAIVGGNLDLSGVELNDANLANASLPGCNLSGANLCEANLSGINLVRANLNRANLHKAYLPYAILREADLRSATLSEAMLERTDLSKANLGKSELVQANLEGANLSYAQFHRAQLSAANLQGANLTDTKMTEADIVGANLSGTNLSGALLNDADLTDANLQYAENWTIEQLSQIASLDGAVMPDRIRLYKLYGDKGPLFSEWQEQHLNKGRRRRQ